MAGYGIGVRLEFMLVPLAFGISGLVSHGSETPLFAAFGSFAMMVWHWFPVLVLAWVWCGLFAVNMLLKEASMSRYPEWAAYKQRSWWLIPFVL